MKFQRHLVNHSNVINIFCPSKTFWPFYPGLDKITFIIFVVDDNYKCFFVFKNIYSLTLNWENNKSRESFFFILWRALLNYISMFCDFILKNKTLPMFSRSMWDFNKLSKRETQRKLKSLSANFNSNFCISFLLCFVFEITIKFSEQTHWVLKHSSLFILHQYMFFACMKLSTL